MCYFAVVMLKVWILDWVLLLLLLNFSLVIFAVVRMCVCVCVCVFFLFLGQNLVTKLVVILGYNLTQ